MARNSRLVLNREQIAEATSQGASGAESSTYGSEQSVQTEDYAAHEAPDYAEPLFQSRNTEAGRRWSLSFFRRWDWIYGLGLKRMIQAGIFVAVAAAIALGFVYLQDTLNLVANVKASLFGPPAERSVAEDASAPTQDTAPSAGQSGYTSASPFPQSTVGVRSGSSSGRTAPTRDDIAAALRTARQGQTDQGQPQTAMTAGRPSNPDEVAALIKRAKGMIGIGDIVAARLLLERAAQAQDAGAALLMAQTYDPAVLGKPDARTITPDPDMARSWYQRAAELGSPGAKQRLAQMQN